MAGLCGYRASVRELKECSRKVSRFLCSLPQQQSQFLCSQSRRTSMARRSQEFLMRASKEATEHSRKGSGHAHSNSTHRSVRAWRPYYLSPLATNQRQRLLEEKALLKSRLGTLDQRQYASEDSVPPFDRGNSGIIHDAGDPSRSYKGLCGWDFTSCLRFCL